MRTLRQKLLERFGDNAKPHVLVSTPKRGGIATPHAGTPFDRASKTVRRPPEDSNPPAWQQASTEWRGQPPPMLERLYDDSAQIVFATTTSWPMEPVRFSPTFEPFDLVVVEEAGKCYPSELLGPLALSRKALLIGDQNQLPPFQLEEAKAAVEHLQEIASKGIGTVGEEAQEILGDAEAKDTDWNEVKEWLLPFANLQKSRPSFMLHDQYRMAPLISDLIGETFYSTKFVNKRSKLDSAPLFRHPVFQDASLVWIDTPHSTELPQAREDLTGHRFNKLEIAIVAKLFLEMESLQDGAANVAILSPYNAQVDRMAGNKGLSPGLPGKCDGIPGFNPRDCVHTVDSFQGNEADLVVVSLVRNNSFGTPRSAWGFMLNPERLNVMLSRARRQLVIVGCSKMVEDYASYEEVAPLTKVLGYIREHGKVVDGMTLGSVVR